MCYNPIRCKKVESNESATKRISYLNNRGRGKHNILYDMVQFTTLGRKVKGSNGHY